MVDDAPETPAEDDVDAVVEPDEDTTEPDVEVAPEWTPPSREEWEKLQKAQSDAAAKLQKANKEAADRRTKLRELERQHEDDAAKAQREAIEAAQAKYKPIVAKNALLEANARTDRVGALIRLLDMDSLEFAGEDVTGLDIEVDRLRGEYPEWFVTEAPEKPEGEKPAARPAPKVTTAPKKPAKEEPKSAGEILAARLLGTK